MTGQELETAVRYGTSILVVVFRNGMHGTIADAPGAGGGTHRRRRDRRGGPGRLRPSLGAAGYSVRDPEDLEPTLAEAHPPTPSPSWTW